MNEIPGLDTQYAQMVADRADRLIRLAGDFSRQDLEALALVDPDRIDNLIRFTEALVSLARGVME